MDGGGGRNKVESGAASDMDSGKASDGGRRDAVGGITA